MKYENIKISIILPNYNSEKYISRAIDSFLDQDYQNKELIIVDGKSSDSSHQIIQQYVSAHANIIWIKEKDINVTDAINIGLKYCTGDFIAFLAADVFYYSNDIFSCVNRNYGLIHFDGIYFDHYFYYPQSKKIHYHKCPNVEFTEYNLLKYGTIAGFDSIFISRDVYKKYQYNPEYNLCSDWEFFLRISQDSLLFMYVEKVCTVDVQDGDNLSIRYREEQMRQIKEVALLYPNRSVKPYFETEQPSLKKEIWQLTKKIVRRVIKK